jgi:hypothetical protein
LNPWWRVLNTIILLIVHHHEHASSHPSAQCDRICWRYADAHQSQLPNLVHVSNLAIADEINALVLDPGSCSIRAGFAGEDVPKSVVPTSYGQPTSGSPYFGENAIHLPRPDVEIRNPYDAEGIVEDWDVAAKLWEYAITSRLTGTRQTAPSKNGLNDGKDDQGDVDMEEEIENLDDQEKVLQEFPLLVSETAWNPTKDREKTIELAMEDWGVPAFFLAKTGQLAAYVSMQYYWSVSWADSIADTRKVKQRHWWSISEHETRQSLPCMMAW